MRYLLTLAFVLLATPCFTQTAETYEIQEDGGGDYTTLQAAETAQQQDLTSTNKILTFEIQETWTSADGAVLVDGWTMDATRFLTIIAVGDAKAGATYSTTAYRIEAASDLFDVRELYVVLDGIQGKITSGSFFDCYATASGGGILTVQNCFFSGNNQSQSRGIFFNSFQSTTIVRNNVVIDCTVEGINASSGGAGGIKIDNNTVENCFEGIKTGSNIVIARNNILWNCTTPLVGDFNTSTLSEENYTDAGSLSYGSCGSCGTGDQLSQSDPFVNLAGENYHLASDATAIDAGKDLSADFTDAIGGKTRDANFDKGADEFIAAEGDPLRMRRRRILQQGIGVIDESMEERWLATKGMFVSADSFLRPNVFVGYNWNSNLGTEVTQ